MENKILITYATKYGSTGEIANKIKELLDKSSATIDLVPVDEVNEINQYTTVIVGSAVYMGQWRKNASRFLRKNVSALKDKNVWIFSSGPTGEGDPVELLKGWRMPKRLEKILDEIKPKEIKVFNGKLTKEKMNFFDKFIIDKVKAPVGDFIDWQDVDRWANKIESDLD